MGCLGYVWGFGDGEYFGGDGEFEMLWDFLGFWVVDIV